MKNHPGGRFLALFVAFALAWPQSAPALRDIQTVDSGLEERELTAALTAAAVPSPVIPTPTAGLEEETEAVDPAESIPWPSAEQTVHAYFGDLLPKYQKVAEAEGARQVVLSFTDSSGLYASRIAFGFYPDGGATDRLLSGLMDKLAMMEVKREGLASRRIRPQSTQLEQGKRLLSFEVRPPFSGIGSLEKGHYVEWVAVSSAEGVVAATHGAAIQAWDIQTKEPLWRAHFMDNEPFDPFHHLVSGALEGGQEVFLLAKGSVIQMRNPRTGEMIHELRGHDGLTTFLTARPDGQWLVSGDRDSTIRIWPSLGGSLGLSQVFHTENIPTDGAVSPDGTLLAFTDRESDQIIRFQLLSEEGKLPADIDEAKAILGFQFGPEGKTLFVVTAGGRVVRRAIFPERGEGRIARRAIFPERGKRRVVRRAIFPQRGERRGARRAFLPERSEDPLAEKVLRQASLDSFEVGYLTTVAFHPKTKRLAYGKAIIRVSEGSTDSPGAPPSFFSHSFHLEVMDLETGDILLSRRHPGKKVTSLAFSLDGKSVVTGDAEGIVRLWQIEQPAAGLEERMPGWLKGWVGPEELERWIRQGHAALWEARPVAVLFDPGLVPGEGDPDRQVRLAGLEESLKGVLVWPESVPLRLGLLAERAGLEERGFRMVEVLPHPEVATRSLPESALPVVVLQALASPQGRIYVDPIFYAGLEGLTLPQALADLTDLFA